MLLFVAFSISTVSSFDINFIRIGRFLVELLMFAFCLGRCMVGAVPGEFKYSAATGIYRLAHTSCGENRVIHAATSAFTKTPICLVSREPWLDFLASR
jgi:hypothetical protein